MAEENISVKIVGARVYASMAGREWHANCARETQSDTRHVVTEERHTRVFHAKEEVSVNMKNVELIVANAVTNALSKNVNMAR